MLDPPPPVSCGLVAVCTRSRGNVAPKAPSFLPPHPAKRVPAATFPFRPLFACLFQSFSGKEKAHKHKQIFPVTARAAGGLPTGWGGGGLPTGGQGSKVYVLCAEPKEHKRFRPGTRPGGIGFPAGRIGDRGDREIVYVPNVYVPFPASS